MRSLRSTFSVAASITRSQSASASSEVTVVMQAIAALFCSALILSFLIRRSRLAEMVASPRCTCASPTSIITTSRPATANAWVMPFPIVPAPATPILPILIAFVLRTGFGERSRRKTGSIPLRMRGDFSGFRGRVPHDAVAERAGPGADPRHGSRCSSATMTGPSPPGF